MSFEFSDRTRTLTICDKDYTYRVGDADMIKALQTVMGKVERLKKVAKDDYYAELQEAGRFIFELVDTILGKGSATAIFTDRPLNDRDLFEFMAWFVEQITDDPDDRELKARIAEYTVDEPISS